MEYFNFCHILINFLVSRIPNSGFLDVGQICQMEQLMSIMVFLSYAVVYAKNFSTISFCLIRVYLLFAETWKKESFFVLIFLILIFSISFAFILALPRYMTGASCVATNPPFPADSVMITSNQPEISMTLSNMIDVTFYPSVIITIVCLNILIMRKLWRKRNQSNMLRRKYDRKAEKSLTITMILILLPVVINSSISVIESFGSFSIVLYIIRPWLIDARAHIIVCWFYYTHPIFCKKKQCSRVTVRRTKDTK
ncbi:hypothetical protein B9Z55_003947 [Caenorhabditis nigoni]|nr:hypothetical protein B9Z55_003947 [Caenorhabditis nigoni]